MKQIKKQLFSATEVHHYAGSGSESSDILIIDTIPFRRGSGINDIALTK